MVKVINQYIIQNIRTYFNDWCSFKVCYSYDNKNWNYIKNTKMNHLCLDIKFTPIQNSIYIAYYIPFKKANHNYIKKILSENVKKISKKGTGFGNNLKYAVHIRTPYTKLPWQYYNAKFLAKNKWEKISLSFMNFKKSNFYQPKQFNYHKIKTIGVVAGFNNFKADISVSEIGFY